MVAQSSVNATGEITLAEAADLLPRRSNGKKVHVRTIQRWIEVGCRGVSLGGQKVGDRWYTTLAAISLFRSQTTAEAVRHRSDMRPTIQAPRRQRAKQAKESLRAKLRAKGFTNYGNSDQEAG